MAQDFCPLAPRILPGSHSLHANMQPLQSRTKRKLYQRPTKIKPSQSEKDQKKVLQNKEARLNTGMNPRVLSQTILIKEQSPLPMKSATKKN
jgi:hypothetical protein